MVEISLHIGNVLTGITGPFPLDAVNEVTRYRPEGFQFNPQFKRGTWDGYVYLYDKRKRTFPSGLTDRVLASLKKAGCEVTLEDSRVDPCAEVDTNIVVNGITPRGPQLEAVDAAINNGRGVIKASTGFGKTDTMAMIIYALGVPTLVMVHTKDLLYQTAERLHTRLGIPIGMIGDGVWDEQDVTVAMFQTVARLIKDQTYHKETALTLQHFDMLMVDEAHHTTSASTWVNTLRYCTAYYRFGFSGTPFKQPPGSELLLIGMTGEQIFDYGLLQAVKDGISILPVVFTVDYEQKDIDRKLPWAKLYKEAIIDHEERNNLIARAALAAAKANKPYVIIVDRIDHGEKLARDLGVPFVSGKTPSATRKRVRDRVDAERIPGFVSTVMDEGVDMKELACIILAAGGKAQHRVIQRIGRGVRKGRHNYCVVIDFFDNQNRTMVRQRTWRGKAYKDLGIPHYNVKTIPDFTNTKLMEKYVSGN